MKALARNRDFLMLQAGQLLSTFGSQSSGVAFPLLALALTHSPAKAGVVAFASVLPYPLLMLPAGFVVDRIDRKRVMVACDVGRAFAVGSLAIALATGHGSYAHLVVVAFLGTSFFAFFNLAESGAVRAVVPRAQIPEAMAWEQSRLSVGVLAGPPVGGLLFGVARALPFVVDALSYVASTISIVAIRRHFEEERARPP